MSYQVLARKLRPATFEALVGQEHVVRALRHALDTDRLHHAYLFTGTRGVGKTTIARVLAKCLNCEQGVSSTPCGECSVCREVAENRFVDLIEVDAASRTRVDDTRELLENAQYLPTRGRYKVYLVDEVHMLSASSFNALLKTLEEPPEHVKFLLATTDPKKVPVTVLSRCLQFQLKNIPEERIAGYLAEALGEEGVDFEEPALTTIAHAARGSMRDALSITDQAIAYGQGAVRAGEVADMLGLVGRDQVSALLDAIATQDAARVLAVTAELAERAVDFEDLLAELIAAFHRLAVEHALQPAERAFAPEVVQLYYQIALIGYRDLQVAPDPRAGLEMTLLRMLAFAPDAGQAERVPRQPAEPAAPTPESAAPKDDSATPADGSAVPGDGSATPTTGAVAATAPADGGAPWHEVVATLSLSGVARMLAEHSELIERERCTWRLRLDSAHDTLLSDGPVAAIERALGEQSAGEEPVKVHVEVGAVAQETPAQRFARLRAERQQAAEQSLATDRTVQTLLSEFGGRIDGVSPID
ncbi:MAG: DNA polymerase III subunit gamma/tau [Gammaproteobacteria bacterium]|jgi:DNA polymerase-3 subunit gamma/tau|nr:DNA polymerase III subunit gamma/tau [Gammaproteobacteria bacterium]